MQEEIFNVEVNEVGRNWLRRFGNLSLIILVVNLLINGLIFYKTVPFVFEQNKEAFESSVRFRNWMYIAYVVIDFILQIIQILLYRKFAITAQSGVDNSNAVVFNQSFRLLFLQLVCFLVQMIITLVYFVYTYYGTKL